MDYRKLETLVNLRNAGEISEEEFQREKEKLKKQADSPFRQGNKLGLEDNVYYMLMHLSQFLGLILPLFGIVAPIFLWLFNKDEDKNVDIHGRLIMNWIISVYIYSIVGIILSTIYIGWVIIIGVVILNIIFAIQGAMRAKEGRFFKYPLSIDFFKMNNKVNTSEVG